MKNVRRKLLLQKEQVRLLTKTEIRQVVGGDDTYGCPATISYATHLRREDLD